MSDTATLSAISALADRMPDAARDIRLNLQSVLETSSLNAAELLDITASVPPGLSADFGTDEISARYVDNVQIDGTAASFQAGRAGAERCKERGCTLRFRFRLAEAGAPCGSPTTPSRRGARSWPPLRPSCCARSKNTRAATASP